MTKREDYISWDTYFMNIAILTSMRSKDPVTQVGSCIINKDNIICGTGYNGFINGVKDNELPWGKNNEDMLENKYPYVIHSEMNAILNKNTKDLKNCILYTTLFPCSECTKLIIQSGITKIIYLDYKEDLASLRMIKLLNIECYQLELKQKIIIEI